MSVTNEEKPSASTNRFFAYIGLGIVTFVLILFGVGAILTHFLWPPQARLSQPVDHGDTK